MKKLFMLNCLMVAALVFCFAAPAWSWTTSIKNSTEKRIGVEIKYGVGKKIFDYIDPKETKTFNFGGDCGHDLKIIYSDGRTEDKCFWTVEGGFHRTIYSCEYACWNTAWDITPSGVRKDPPDKR